MVQSTALAQLAQPPAAGLVAQPFNLVFEDLWTTRSFNGVFEVVSVAPVR